MAKDIAIVLNNGSVNSLVTTALTAQKYRLAMLYASTPSPSGSRSRSAYEQQVAQFKPYREHTLEMPFLTGLSGSVPSAMAAAAADPRTPASVTPKLIELMPLLGVAARFAVHYSACAIYIGLRVGPNSEDLASGTEYFQIWQEMLQITCGHPELDVVAPLLELEPWQVVDVGYNLSAHFDRTWSCSEEGPEPCWACRGCRARESAFQQAAKPDPLRTPKKG